MFELSQISVFATMFAILVVIVNVLTQIFKSFASKNELPTRVFVLLSSIALTIITFVAACQIYSIKIVWYMIVGAIVTGFIVAYCAMFGYDNLYGELKDLLNKLFGEKN